MRVALAIASLMVAGCASKPDSLDAAYRDTRSLLQSEQYTLALTRIDDALRIAERNPDVRVRWRFRFLKAEILLAERRAAEVGTVLVGDLPDGAGWIEYRARDLLLKGTAAYYLAHYSEAQDLLARAAPLAQQSGSASLSAEVEMRQANLLVSQGQFNAAETVWRHVIGLASGLHDTYLEDTATGSLGYMLLTASKYDEAIMWLERARERHARLGANRSMARDALNLAFCFHRLGDYPRAQVQYEQAR